MKLASGGQVMSNIMSPKSEERPKYSAKRRQPSRVMRPSSAPGARPGQAHNFLGVRAREHPCARAAESGCAGAQRSLMGSESTQGTQTDRGARLQQAPPYNRRTKVLGTHEDEGCRRPRAATSNASGQAAHSTAGGRRPKTQLNHHIHGRLCPERAIWAARR